MKDVLLAINGEDAILHDTLPIELLAICLVGARQLF